MRWAAVLLLALAMSTPSFDAPTSVGADGNERVRTGRPALEVWIRSCESAYPPDETILLAHFATFAGGSDNP